MMTAQFVDTIRDEAYKALDDCDLGAGHPEYVMPLNAVMRIAEDHDFQLKILFDPYDDVALWMVRVRDRDDEEIATGRGRSPVDAGRAALTELSTLPGDA
jgi:hypothetical protein